MMRNPRNKRTLINRLGWLGVIILVSYTAAVVFSPLAYPGYDWMSRAVSDLIAANAPSLALWNQLDSFYGLCGITCIMGIFERFSVFAATGFNAVLGIYLWNGFRGFNSESSGKNPEVDK
jgi:hypothetical membrane protein